MDADVSEGLFASYLDTLRLKYQRHVPVRDARNVDFRIEGNPPILCDVKEVRPGANESKGIDAYAHLRDDLSDLRRKFGPSRPQAPVLLVSVNFSGNLFTGFSVARAMLGDVGAEFSADGRGNFHHLRRGNASMTASHHTLISGIFVFDCEPGGRHALFPNPYAAHPIPTAWFPLVKRIAVAKDASEASLSELANITFWHCDEQAP
jgi:hypothetical protein